jgi:hypothetical protein
MALNKSVLREFTEDFVRYEFFQEPTELIQTDKGSVQRGTRGVRPALNLGVLSRIWEFRGTIRHNIGTDLLRIPPYCFFLLMHSLIDDPGEAEGVEEKLKKVGQGWIENQQDLLHCFQNEPPLFQCA